MGRSGLTVSRLGLGTLSWGSQTDPADAAELLSVFADAGGTLVDTAPHYGEGHAEELLGTLLHKTVRRDEPKVGRNDPCPCGSGKKYKRCHGK